MDTPLRGTSEAIEALVVGETRKFVPGQGAARMGLARDVMAEDWATRNHPRRLYYRPTDATDGRQALQVVKGRLVNPATSMSTGGTVVRQRSRKGKFRRVNFVTMQGKADGLMMPPRPKPVHSGADVAYVHDGNRRTAKHVPLREWGR